MTTDTGTCPECHSGFTVSRYGRQIPCPHCGELLDIRPDHSMSGNGRGPSVDWRNVFKDEIDYLTALRDEVTLLGIAAAVTAINATNVLTCAYCGQEYPPGSPVHGAAVLTEHIRLCDKHPMRALEAEIANTIAIAAEAIGTDPAYRSLACVAVLADRAKGLEQRLARIEFDARRRYPEVTL